VGDDGDAKRSVDLKQVASPPSEEAGRVAKALNCLRLQARDVAKNTPGCRRIDPVKLNKYRVDVSICRYYENLA
jgi:hypothetical protein